MGPSRKKKNRIPFKMIGFYLLYGFIILECSSRLFIYQHYKINPFQAHKIIYTYYPEMEGLREADISARDDFFDVLVLGASSVNKRFSRFDEILKKRLSRRNVKARIHNVSAAAHSTRDSLLKYQHLKDVYFDLVIYYHGINDVRVNNIPPELFKVDYSHYKYNEKVNVFLAHPEINRIAFPWALHDFFVNIKHKLLNNCYIPVHKPRHDWLQYGLKIRSAQTFRSNLKDLLQLAKKKDEPVMLMTFAYYIPQDYSQSKYDDGLLDYTPSALGIPIEMWGLPVDVEEGLKQHNQVIRELSQNYDNVIFLDQKDLIPSSGEYFIDICHFSDRGMQEFVKQIIFQTQIFHDTRQ